jgi:hypothetical protein
MENLTRQHKSWKPLLALMGARPSLDLFAYFHSIMILMLYLLASIAALSLIISEVLICVEVIQHPLKAIFMWLQQQGWAISAVLMFTLGISLFAYINTRQAVKHLKGLIALIRANPAQSPPVTLSEYIQVSLPAWLQSFSQVDIPDDVLDTIQQHVNPDEPWMKNLATFLKECMPAYSPTISILVSLGDRVTISVLGPNGKHQQFIITQEQTAALVGRLALQEKGTWMLRKHIIQPIYGEHSENVTQHISRLNDSLNKAVQKVVSQPSKREGDQSNGQENKLKLIEYDESRKENLWRLLITCVVEIFPEAVSLYEQIIAAKKDSNIPPPERETLDRGCRHIMEHYGKGLFAGYQKKRLNKYQYWPWATEYYTRYQDKYLTVLQYAAKREWAFAMEHKNNPDVLHTSIRQTAQLYIWRIQVALGVIPNLPHAEQAVCMCLKLYRMIGDLVTARFVFQTYAAFMKEQDDAWKPPVRVTEFWPDATSLPESDTES